MDIYSFISKYKDEFETPFTHEEYSNNVHLIWFENFKKASFDLWPSVKSSYFQVSKELIEKHNFEELHKVFLIHYVDIFLPEDEVEFLELISLSTQALRNITNEDEKELALSYLYQMLDILFHQGLYSQTYDQLKILLLDLERIMNAIKMTDPYNYKDLVEQKIDLILSRRQTF